MNEPENLRTLPASRIIEKSTLAWCFQFPQESMQKCIEELITQEHFHFGDHQILYAILSEFYLDNEPINFRIITEVLNSRGQLGEIGGAAEITSIATEFVQHTSLDQYLKVLKEKALLRKVINECSSLITRAYNDQENVPAIFGETETALLRIIKLNEGQKIHARNIKELVLRAMDRIDAALLGTAKIEFPTGIADLDFVTQGFRAPEVTVVAGKPSDGKTALALNICEELAIRQGKRIGIISLEMSDDQLVDRMLSSMAWINIRDLKRSRDDDADKLAKIKNAATKLAAAKIYIRDDGQLSISEISATLAAWKSKHGLDFAVIDHAQLARGDGRTTGRTEEVEQISRALKPIAKRMEIPLLVLSQVSESSTGEYSTKNSKALQEDADNLWTISHNDKGAWINISKQRDGERGTSVEATFISHLMRFTSRAKEKDEQPELVDPHKKRRK